MEVGKVVAITGATGFLASHIIKQLLEKGYIVHGSVRSKKPEKIAHLTAFDGSDRLKLFEADLLKEGSFDEMCQDADVVFHCASPYVISVTDPQKELVDPAVLGTINVLNACKKSNKVRRVVLTSSVAAITDSPHGILNEDVWNTKSSLTRNPYYYSKTVAEREAWKYVQGVGKSSQKVTFDLVVLNPFLICGPAFDQSLNESNKIFLDILTGKYPVVLALDLAIVDVRDVAKAHILAAEASNASGRYVTVENVTSMKNLCEHLIQNFPTLTAKVPSGLDLSCSLGNLLMKGAAHFQPEGVSDYLKTHLGKTVQVDNSKIKKDLNMEFMPLSVTIKDTIENLIQKGHFVVDK